MSGYRNRLQPRAGPPYLPALVACQLAVQLYKYLRVIQPQKPANKGECRSKLQQAARNIAQLALTCICIAEAAHRQASRCAVVPRPPSTHL